MGRFESTAPWYARYRPRYPTELIEQLAAAAGLDQRSRVLDLGAGPGHVAAAIASLVGEVVAVDVEPDMLAQIDTPNVRTSSVERRTWTRPGVGSTSSPPDARSTGSTPR